jgi:hypothetical protein
MQFWITLLFLDFLAVAIVIVGKAADWKWKITVRHWSGDFGWLMVALTVLLATLAVLRMIPFVRGVMSLLELNGWLAKKSIQAHEGDPDKPDGTRPASSFEPPEGYGRVISTKRRRH